MKRISVLVLLLLAGCATGVKMTDEEAAACRAQGCTVWTEAELQGLAALAFQQGLLRGAQSQGKSW